MVLGTMETIGRKKSPYNGSEIVVMEMTPQKPTAPVSDMSKQNGRLGCAPIWGQEHVKRGLEVSAAGSHNVLMV